MRSSDVDVFMTSSRHYCVDDWNGMQRRPISKTIIETPQLSQCCVQYQKAGRPITCLEKHTSDLNGQLTISYHQ